MNNFDEDEDDDNEEEDYVNEVKDINLNKMVR